MSACETNIKNSLIAKATQFFKENNSEITVMPISRIQEQENIKIKLNNVFINLSDSNTERTLSNSNQIKQGVVELFENNPELANAVYSALGFNTINVSEITYTDEEGNPCAKMGLTNTVKGTDWKIVKDFKGKPKHSNGGVDITISDKGVSMRRGGKDIKAQYGLLIPAQNLSISNQDKPPFNEWYKTVPKEKNDTTNYNLRRAYELAPKEQLDEFVKNPDAHLYSVYENPKTGEYEFMKSKNHPTLKYEIDWYNSEEGKEFRNNYDLDMTNEYYKYIPKIKK